MHHKLRHSPQEIRKPSVDVKPNIDEDDIAVSLIKPPLTATPAAAGSEQKPARRPQRPRGPVQSVPRKSRSCPVQRNSSGRPSIAAGGNQLFANKRGAISDGTALSPGQLSRNKLVVKRDGPASSNGLPSSPMLSPKPSCDAKSTASTVASLPPPKSPFRLALRRKAAKAPPKKSKSLPKTFEDVKEEYDEDGILERTTITRHRNSDGTYSTEKHKEKIKPSSPRYRPRPTKQITVEEEEEEKPKAKKERQSGKERKRS
mmetsp:Transcript_15888/g.29502  ORF Transcript_15888/g.29502 Transcript_15888/m.29502 type:complete len:259 (+) Transcript_15888:169-945(+)